MVMKLGMSIGRDKLWKGDSLEFPWASIQQYSNLKQYPLVSHHLNFRQLEQGFHHSYTIMGKANNH